MKKHNLILLAILVLAFILRVWGLNKVPPELFGDELDVGYHAYSLLKTGRDYYGQFLPTYIHSLSEWRAPLLMYATVPFVAIFGLNEWGVRLPSAIFGVITVYLIYLLTYELVKKNQQPTTHNQQLGLVAAFLLAISPWHLQYSRAAFEASLLLTLILTGLYLFLKSFKNHTLLILSAIIFSLTFYTYSTANLFTPLFILILLSVYKSEMVKLDKRIILPSILVFVIVSIPIGYHIIFGKAAERYSQFSIFTDSEVVREVNTKRLEAGNTFIEKITHNKPILWGKKIISNYAIAFSPQFLFISGDITFRHSIHSVGEFYWFMLPLIILGLFALSRIQTREKYLWLGWLLIAPISASITRDGAVHATRLILMLPPLTVIASQGVKNILDSNIKVLLKRLIIFFLSIFIFIEFGLYLHEYWIHYPKESWRWWHVGYKDTMTFMKNVEENYDLVVFNNTYEPALIRFLFWWQYPPEKFIQEFSTDKEVENILPGFRGFSLTNKYYFGSAKDYQGGVIAFVKPNMMYLVSQRDEVGGDWDWEKNPPVEIKVLKTVRNPFGEPIFYVVTTR